MKFLFEYGANLSINVTLRIGKKLVELTSLGWVLRANGRDQVGKSVQILAKYDVAESRLSVH